MTPPRCALLLPGDPLARTGGSRYDRRVVLGLQQRGWQVETIALDASFPRPTAAALAGAAAACARLPDGTPVIADGLAFGALPELAAREAGRLHWLALVHHPLWLETGLAPDVAALLKASEAAALAHAARIVVTSGATLSDLTALGVAPRHATVIEPGADEAPEAAGSGPGEPLQLLCAATLTPRKAHTVLVEALAGLADRSWRLRCLGSLTLDPRCAAAVRQAIVRHGLDGRITLDGEADDAALADAYHRADVFVLPSLHEGYGMVLAEALARGLPIVSTTGGAIPRTVPAEAALLVAPGDAGALRVALARVIDDPALRAGLRAGARAARARRRDWADVAAAFDGLLRAVAGEGAAA